MLANLFIQTAHKWWENQPEKPHLFYAWVHSHRCQVSEHLKVHLKFEFQRICDHFSAREKKVPINSTSNFYLLDSMTGTADDDDPVCIQAERNMNHVCVPTWWDVKMIKIMIMIYNGKK